MATNLSYDEQIEALLNAVNDYQSPIDTSPPVEVEDKYNLSWTEAAAQLRGIGYTQEHDWTEEDFSFIDPVTNETWYKNTIANDRPFYNLLAENMDKPFVSRLFDSSAPSIQSQDDEGNLVDITHLMASSDNLVYPTVVANPDNPSELIDLTDEGIDPYDHAISSGNYIQMADERNARAFGEHYKNFIPPKKEEDRISNGWSKKKPIAHSDEQFVMGYIDHREKNHGDGWDKLERINEEIPLAYRAQLPEGHRHRWEAGMWDILKHGVGDKLWGMAHVFPSAISGPLQSVYSKGEAILEADFGKLGDAVYDMTMGKNPDEILNGFKKWRAETGRVGKVLDESTNNMELVQDYFARNSEAIYQKQMSNPRWQAYNVHLSKIREKSTMPWSEDYMGADDFATYVLDAMSSHAATYGPAVAVGLTTKSVPAFIATVRTAAFFMEGTDEWRQEYQYFRDKGLSPQESSERAWVGYALYGTASAGLEGWAAKQWLSPNLRALLDNDKKILWEKVKGVVRKVPKTDKIGRVFPSAASRSTAGKYGDAVARTFLRPVTEYMTEGAQRLSQGVVQERYTDIDWSWEGGWEKHGVYTEAAEEARAGAWASFFTGMGADVVTQYVDITASYADFKTKKSEQRRAGATQAEIVEDDITEGKDAAEVIVMATIDKFMDGDNFTEAQLGSDAFQKLENLDIITDSNNILEVLKLGGEQAIIDAGYTVDEVLDELESYYGESTPNIRALGEAAIKEQKTAEVVPTTKKEESTVKQPITAPEQPQVTPKVVIPGMTIATADDFDVDTTEDEAFLAERQERAKIANEIKAWDMSDSELQEAKSELENIDISKETKESADWITANAPIALEIINQEINRRKTPPVVIPGMTVMTSDDFIIDEGDVPTEVPTGEAPVEEGISELQALKNKLAAIKLMSKDKEMYEKWKDRAKELKSQIEKLEAKPSPKVAPKFNVVIASGYAARTQKTAAADVTYDFSKSKKGSGATRRMAGNKWNHIPINKMGLPITTSPEYSNAIEAIAASLLAGEEVNIAGHGIYSIKANQDAVDVAMSNMFSLIAEKLKQGTLPDSAKIVSGGQTGFDEAAAKAAMAVGIPTEVIAPKGWLFRDKSGKDIANEAAFKARFEQEAPVATVEYKGTKYNLLEKEAPGPHRIVTDEGHEVAQGTSAYYTISKLFEIDVPVAGYDLQQRDIETQNNLEDVPLPRGYKHYKVAMADVPLEGDKRPKIVAGKPIKLKGSKREFFLYKYKEEYKVVDSRTGTFLGSWRGTQKDAIEIAQRNLDKAIKSGVYKDAIVSTERKLASRPQYQRLPEPTGLDKRPFIIRNAIQKLYEYDGGKLIEEIEDLVREAISVRSSNSERMHEIQAVLYGKSWGYEPSQKYLDKDEDSIDKRLSELFPQTMVPTRPHVQVVLGHKASIIGSIGRTLAIDFIFEMNGFAVPTESIIPEAFYIKHFPLKDIPKGAPDINYLALAEELVAGRRGPQAQNIGRAITDLLDEQDSGFPLISEADEQFQKIITKLKKDFPDVITLVVENLYDDHGIEVAGLAFESLVAWSNSKATLDTAPHEYFHVLFNALKHVAEVDGNAAVKKLIDGGLKEFGWNEEELVQRVAELYTEKVLTDNEGVVDKSLTARLKTWLRKVWNAIKKAFGRKIKGKTYAEQLADIFFNAPDRFISDPSGPGMRDFSQLVPDMKRMHIEGALNFQVLEEVREEEQNYAKHTIGRVLAMQRLSRLSAVDYSIRPLQELDKKFSAKKFPKGITINKEFVNAITRGLSKREDRTIRAIVNREGLMGEKIPIEDFKATVLSYYFPLRIQRGMSKNFGGIGAVVDPVASQIYTSFALDDYNDDYGEWSFKVPITVAESHPWFTKSDNNTIGWFRGDSNPENTKEFRLFEKQSDTFQKDLSKTSEIAILMQGMSKEERAIQDNFIKNIGQGDWQQFFFNSIMQFLYNNGYSSVLIPYGNTVKDIQNFDKVEEKLKSLPNEIQAQKAVVNKLKYSPHYVEALKEFKTLAPKIKKLFNDNKLASIIAVNEGEPTVWSYNKDTDSWTVQWHYEPVEPTSKKEIANDDSLWNEIASNPYNFEFSSVAGMETYLHKTKDKNKTVRRWTELNETDHPGSIAYWSTNKEYEKLDRLQRDLKDYQDAKGKTDAIVAKYDKLKKFILKKRKGYSELYTDDKGRTWVRTWLTEKDSLAVPMYQQLKNDTEAWDKAMILIDGAYREMSNDAKLLGKKLPLGDFVRVMNDELPDRASDVFNAWLRLRFPNGRNRLMSQTVEGPDGRFMSEGDFAKSFAGVYNDFEDGLSKIESDDYLMSAKHGEGIEKVFLSEIGGQMSVEGFAKFMNAAIDADYTDWSTNELPRYALISLNALTPKQQLNLKRLYVRANSVVTANQGKVMNVRNNLIYNESLIGGLQLKGPVNPFNEETSSMREPKMIYEIANPDMKSRLLWLNKTDMFITTNRDPLDIFGTKDRTFIKGAPYTLEEWDNFEDRLNDFVYEEDDVFGLVPLFSRSEKGKLAFAAISKKQLKIASDPRILKAYWSAEIKAFKESNDSVEDIKAFKAQINSFNGYREGEQKFKDPQWLAGEIARYEAYKELMPLSMIADGANFFKRIAIVTTPVFTSPLMEDITGAYFDFNNITFVDKNGVEQKAVDVVPGFKNKMSYSDGSTLIGANTFNLVGNAFGLDRSRKIIKTIVWKSDKSLAMKHEMQLSPSGLKLYEGYGTKAQKLVAEVRSDNNLYVGDKIVNMIFSDDEAKIFTGKSGDIVTVRANEIGLINYASKHGSAKYPIQSLNFVDNQEVLDNFNENVLPRIKERLGRMLLLTGHPKDNAERIYGWLKTLRSDDIMAPSNVLVEKNKVARLGMHSDNEPMLNVLMKTQLIEGALQADFTEGVQLHSAPDWTDVVPEGSVSIALEDARAVLKPYAQAKGLDLKVIGKDYLKKINQWLINNPIYVRVSRSPVVGINGAYPARVSELHDRGGQIILNTSQGYKNLEFDFDGDTIQLDVIDEAEFLALNEMLDKALVDGRVQAIDLNKYDNDAATYSDLSKRENAYVLAEKFGTGARAIGEISNVQAVHGMLQHTFGYMEVTNDDGSVEYIHVKKYQQKEVFEEGGLNEKMTIETQIRTWQQAALDNGKYLLLDAWDYSQEKLFRKLFTVTSLVDGKLVNNHPLTDAQWDAMKPLVDMYKIPGRIRNGGTFNEQYRMDTQLIESQRYLEFTKDREGYYRRVLYSPENQPKDAGIAVPGEEVSGPVTVGRLQFRDAKAPIESVATALAEVWEPIQLNEPERITPARFIPLVYKSVHQQAMKLLDESKENAVDTWLASDFTKADMIKHGMEGHEYAQELHNALVTALVPQTKKGTAVDIKWAQHSISAIASGRKTKTTRTKELPVGGTFQVNGVEYIITAVEQKSLAQVIAHDYRDEGYNTPKELESALKNLGLKMDMGRKLNVHTFKEYKEDDVGGEFAGYVGPQSWGRNPVLQKFQLEFEEKFADLHPIAQEVATYSFLEGLPSINDKMEQVRGNNRNVLPPFSNKKTTLDPTIMANYSMKYNDIINDREKRLEEPSHFSNLTTFKNIIRRACP